MAEVSSFTQPDSSPAYFVDFLDFLDKLPDVKRVRAAAEAQMRLKPGDKALDLGCGIGGAVFRIAEIVTGPTGLAAGVDISEALVKEAQRRAATRPELEFRTGDACALPYPDHFFDATRSERVFLYLPDRLGAIREMMRVTKPGGRVLVMDTDVDCTAIHSSNPALTRKMTSLMAASLPNPQSARELPSLAKRAGLKEINVETLAVATPHSFLQLAMTDSLYKCAERGLASREEVDEFFAGQAALEAQGDFFQMWFFALVAGTVE